MHRRPGAGLKRGKNGKNVLDFSGTVVLEYPLQLMLCAEVLESADRHV